MVVMTKNPRGKTPLLLIAAVTLLAILGGLLLHSTKKTSLQEPTANWKTYNGNGYSIAMPNDFYIKSENNIDTAFSNEDEKIISIRIENTQAKDIKEFAKGILFTRPTTIYDYEAIEIINDVAKVPFEGYVLINSGFAYHINNQAILDSNPKNDKHFDQILSTFRFIDSDKEAIRCGGFAYRPCPEGYTCKIEYTGKTDAEGICVKN